MIPANDDGLAFVIDSPVTVCKAALERDWHRAIQTEGIENMRRHSFGSIVLHRFTLER